MLFLSETAHEVNIALDGAVSSANVTFVSYYQTYRANQSRFTNLIGDIANATPVPLVPAPDEDNMQVRAQHIVITNEDSATRIVTVTFTDGVKSNNITFELQAGWWVLYMDTGRWIVYDDNGFPVSTTTSTASYPATELVWGTGASSSSSPDATWDDATKVFNVQGTNGGDDHELTFDTPNLALEYKINSLRMFAFNNSGATIGDMDGSRVWFRAAYDDVQFEFWKSSKLRFVVGADDISYVIPTAAHGAAGTVLSEDGAGNLYWQSIIAGVSSVFGRTGNVTAQSGDYTTAQVTESGNLYFTEARVRASVLTGLSITGGSISAADSVLGAFGKIQNQINGVLGGAMYQGVWNATTNSPALASGVGTKGYYYVVSVAGSTNLDGTTDWKVGDWAIFNGTTWDKVDNTDAVSSVNGAIGAVSLVLASANFVNQGTTTTVLHGNASGNPSWAAVALATDVSGILPVANGGSGVATIGANLHFSGPATGAAAAPTWRALDANDIPAHSAGLITTGILAPDVGGTGINNATRTITINTNNGIFSFSGAYTLTVAANGSVSGTNTGDQTISLTGDVTGSGTGSFAATIANDAVTYAKMQNISATQRVHGRNTAGAGDTEEVTLTQLLDWISGSVAQGDILYRDASGWARLGAGTSGQYLKTQGAAANPIWATVAAGSGTVTSVGTGNGLTGGAIATTGTIDLLLNASGGLSKILGAGTNELGIAASGVTNAMLAGSIGDTKLASTYLYVDGTRDMTGSLTPATSLDLGSTTKPWRNLYLYGAATYGTHYLKLTGTPTGTRTLTLPDATDTIVGKATTDIFTNKTMIATTNVVEEISAITDSATPTPTGGSLRNFFDVTALAQAAAFAAPSGSPANCNRLVIRIKDNGTARALTWNSIYAACGVALPSTTILSKILVLGFIYNTANSLNKWQLIASAQEA